jgi:hypothetical protein
MLKREGNQALKLLDKVVNSGKNKGKKSFATTYNNKGVEANLGGDDSNFAKEMGLSAEEFKALKANLKEAKESGAVMSLLNSKSGKRNSNDVGPFDDGSADLHRMFSDNSQDRKSMEFKEFKLGQRKKKAKSAHPVWKYLEELEKFLTTNKNALKPNIQIKICLKSISEMVSG